MVWKTIEYENGVWTFINENEKIKVKINIPLPITPPYPMRGCFGTCHLAIEGKSVTYRNYNGILLERGEGILLKRGKIYEY